MKSLKALKTDTAEPMYDDVTLVMVEQQETEELVAALVQYCKSLERQVVDLRCRINRLTPVHQAIPFPEPHSDLYEVFYHYAAYPKFKHLMKPLL